MGYSVHVAAVCYLLSLSLSLSLFLSLSLSPPPLLLPFPVSSVHQLSLFNPLSSRGMAEAHSSEAVDGVMSPTQLEFGKPTKSSEKFVVGRSHEFVESDVKFRIPPVCSYCSVLIQRMYMYNDCCARGCVVSMASAHFVESINL